MANESRSPEVRQCMELLSELEEIVNGARASFTDHNMKIVSANTVLDKLYTVKKLLPDSVAHAIQIVNDADGIRAGAMEEAKVTRETCRRENDAFQSDLNKRRQAAEAELADIQRRSAGMLQQAQNQANQLLQQATAQANQMVQQASAQANAAAQQILAQARLEADQLKSREQVYQQALQDAQRIRSETEAELLQARRQTFDYLDGMVGQLEHYVGAMLSDVHQERQALNGRRD